MLHFGCMSRLDRQQRLVSPEPKYLNRIILTKSLKVLHAVDLADESLGPWAHVIPKVSFVFAYCSQCDADTIFSFGNEIRLPWTFKPSRKNQRPNAEYYIPHHLESFLLKTPPEPHHLKRKGQSVWRALVHTWINDGSKMLRHAVCLFFIFKMQTYRVLPILQSIWLLLWIKR